MVTAEMNTTEYPSFDQIKEYVILVCDNVQANVNPEDLNHFTNRINGTVLHLLRNIEDAINQDNYSNYSVFIGYLDNSLESLRRTYKCQ